MSSEKKHCKCGRFAASGQTRCWGCMETESLEKRLRECKAKLGEFVGPDGRSWRVDISAQNHTFKDHDAANRFAQTLIDLGVWHMDLKRG